MLIGKLGYELANKLLESHPYDSEYMICIFCGISEEDKHTDNCAVSLAQIIVDAHNKAQ